MSRISDPFESTHHLTERSINQRFVEWINDIVHKENLDLGEAWQETILSDHKQPDIIIEKSPGSRKPLCLIELKLPHFEAIDYAELIEPAFRKSQEIGAPYFATSNLNELVLFETSDTISRIKVRDQLVDRYKLEEIYDPEQIRQPSVEIRIKRRLKLFLIEFIEIAKGTVVKPKRAIDEFLIYRFQSSIQTLQVYYRHLIRQKVEESEEFRKDLQSWFNEQGWDFAFSESDYGKVARQAAYLLINKLLFYVALQETHNLEPLSIPEDLSSGDRLRHELQWFFDKVLEIDYETIFTTDFIDQLAFPENERAVGTIKEVIRDLNQYRVSEIAYDVIGRIFEDLIPISERHRLGQYFTRSDVVDLILRYCLEEEDDKILDPACGAGTFLVRAYRHKRFINPCLDHEDILENLWGNDVAKFPAHLATINLAVSGDGLAHEYNYPRITQRDFFDIQPDIKEMPHLRRGPIETLNQEEIEETMPRWFDVIVGNPPYTRQEEIEGMAGVKSKDEIIEVATSYEGRKKKRIATISKRAGIYNHFFVHCWKFLHEGGRFGFIVSNAWMNVDYGKYLQEFLLDHYKIIAIIESKVERWFAAADVNTCVVILEKCSEPEYERDENLVRFVQLKKPLDHFIPPAERTEGSERERFRAIDNLIELIENHDKLFMNDEIRIYPKCQKELWDEGFDEKADRYVGSKWGKYIRAPDIFFQILEQCGEYLTRLDQIVTIGRGLRTGANNFFYLNEDELRDWNIERQFVKKLIKSPKRSETILLDTNSIDEWVLYIDKNDNIKGYRVEDYVKFGEDQNINEKRPGKYWMCLDEIDSPDILIPVQFHERFTIFLNKELLIPDQQLNYMSLPQTKNIEPLVAILNSTLFSLLIEVFGRTQLGEGSLQLAKADLEQIMVIDLKSLSQKQKDKLRKKLRNFWERPIQSIFEELNVESVEDLTLEDIASDRRELDQVIMGDILGLDEAEQLEVYKALIDLVSSRIERAKSVTEKKREGGVDVDKLVELILSKIDDKSFEELFAEIRSCDVEERLLPNFRSEPNIRKSLLGFELTDGKTALLSENELESQYLKTFWEMQQQSVPVPLDFDTLEKIVPELRSSAEETKKIIESYLVSIKDEKLRQKIQRKIWSKLIEFD